MSGRWPEVSQGSLQMPTSPSRHSAGGADAQEVRQRARQRHVKGWDTDRVLGDRGAGASKITQAKSLDSRTIGENEVRRSVAAASSAMAIRRVQTTWSATGSSMMDGIQALHSGWVKPIRRQMRTEWSADFRARRDARGGRSARSAARTMPKASPDLRNPCQPLPNRTRRLAQRTLLPQRVNPAGADHEMGRIPRHPSQLTRDISRHSPAPRTSVHRPPRGRTGCTYARTSGPPATYAALSNTESPAGRHAAHSPADPPRARPPPRADFSACPEPLKPRRWPASPSLFRRKFRTSRSRPGRCHGRSGRHPRRCPWFRAGPRHQGSCRGSIEPSAVLPPLERKDPAEVAALSRPPACPRPPAAAPHWS